MEIALNRSRTYYIQQSYNLLEYGEKIILKMSTLEQIEAAILKLSSDDLEKLRKWFSDLDYQRWDRDLEQDMAEKKLEALANEAIADFEAGNCQEI